MRSRPPWEIDEYEGREWENSSGPFFAVCSTEVMEENKFSST